MNPMEEILVPNTTNSSSNNLSKPSSSFERRVRPQKAAAVNCPRCDSTNTKFCYYNNYSLSQPRYFCKTCRRYWTEGGTLRNIPVGGGSRKNKRPSSSSSSSSRFPDLVVSSASTSVLSHNPRIHHHDQYGQDLNLGFPPTNNFKNVSEFLQVPNFDATSSFLPIANPVYTPAAAGELIPMPEFKIPSLTFSFSLDGGSNLEDGRLLFPFEELKTSTSTTHDHGQSNKDQNCDSNGFWKEMMGGGSWFDYTDRWSL